MVRFVGLCFGMLVRLFRGRRSLLLENLALRQQLGRIRSVASGRILSQERLGGLHHRYNRAA
jgi:hypothetical protein